MICAGSLAAKSSGIALGEPITSHPSVKGDLEKRESRFLPLDSHLSCLATASPLTLFCPVDYQYSEDRVVISNNLVTR